MLRDREDLRMTRRTIIMFPFYRTWELLFRLHALLKNVIEYAPWRRKNETIAYREESVHDLPPVCHTTGRARLLCAASPSHTPSCGTGPA